MSYSHSVHILGDSFARRFGVFLKSNQDQEYQIVVRQFIGMSGYTINQLKQHLKLSKITFEPNYPLAVFIGSNDVLKGGNFPLFKSQYLSLIRFLHRTNPGIRLILNELPSYPRFRSNYSTMQFVCQVNQLISSLGSPSTIVIKSNLIFQHVRYFNRFYGNSARTDGIHLNDKAHRKLLQQYTMVLNQIGNRNR